MAGLPSVSPFFSFLVFPAIDRAFLGNPGQIQRENASQPVVYVVDVVV